VRSLAGVAFLCALAAPGVAIAQQKPALATTSADGHRCPGNVHTGAYDKPGPDVAKALGAYDALRSSLDSYHVQDRVIDIAIDLSMDPAALDLVADNVADVPFIQSSVPNPFQDVPIEVTLSKPYDRFLTYMLRTRGLSRAFEPVSPPGCPRFADQDSYSRPDLDVMRALAARIDLEADLAKSPPVGKVDGIGIDMEGPAAKLDVTVDEAEDVDSVRARVPESFEGVPTEVSVIETIDTTDVPDTDFSATRMDDIGEQGRFGELQDQ
jgi:hypothetical protein